MYRHTACRSVAITLRLVTHLSFGPTPPSYTVAFFKTSRSTSGTPQNIVRNSAAVNMGRISLGSTDAMPLQKCSRPRVCAVR